MMNKGRDANKVSRPNFQREIKTNQLHQQSNKMSVEAMKRAIAFQPTNSRTKPVLLILAWRADEAGKSYAGHARIAHDTGLSVATVKRYLKALEKDEVVSVMNRVDEHGHSTSNLYQVHLPSVAFSQEQAKANRKAKPKAKPKAKVTPGHGDPTPRFSVTLPPVHSELLKKEEIQLETTLPGQEEGTTESMSLSSDQDNPFGPSDASDNVIRASSKFQRHQTADIARGRWREILPAVGIPSSFLTGRHGPCPACQGEDRFRFTDRNSDGDYYCSACGAGKGIGLVAKVNGCTYAEAAQKIDEVIGYPRRRSTR